MQIFANSNLDAARKNTCYFGFRVTLAGGQPVQDEVAVCRFRPPERIHRGRMYVLCIASVSLFAKCIEFSGVSAFSIVDFGFLVMGYGLRVAGYGLQVG